MRILVAGATGYVGSRLVPELVRRGHDVVAASSSPPAPDRFAWGADVEWRQMDATQASDVRRATERIDAVCYLVHSLDILGFTTRDRVAAEQMRAGIDANGVRRVVYLSGLVPDVPVRRLSPHIASRLEVEEILATTSAATLSLRAGVVIGAGSTSFEIMRQLAETLLVRPVPSWLHSAVQPVAIADVVRVLAATLEADGPTGHRDLGGPDVVSYPDLLTMYCHAAGLTRVSVPIPGPPMTLTALAAGLVTAAPYWTAAALVRSLRHDMVCATDQPADLPTDGEPMIGARAAMDLAVQTMRMDDKGVPGTWPHGRESSDPGWVQEPWWDGRVIGQRLPFASSIRSVSHIAEHRVRGVLRALHGSR